MKKPHAIPNGLVAIARQDACGVHYDVGNPSHIHGGVCSVYGRDRAVAKFIAHAINNHEELEFMSLALYANLTYEQANRALTDTESNALDRLKIVLAGTI